MRKSTKDRKARPGTCLRNILTCWFCYQTMQEGQTFPACSIQDKDPGFIYLFLKVLFIFLERVEGRKKETEKHRCARETSIASCTHPPGDLACYPGMCPYQNRTRPLFGLQAGAQLTEPPPSGQDPGFKHGLYGHGHFEDFSFHWLPFGKQEVFPRIELN